MRRHLALLPLLVASSFNACTHEQAEPSGDCLPDGTEQPTPPPPPPPVYDGGPPDGHPAPPPPN